MVDLLVQFLLLEDYFSYDVGFLYYDYPGMTDENNVDGTGGSGKVWISLNIMDLLISGLPL